MLKLIISLLKIIADTVHACDIMIMLNSQGSANTHARIISSARIARSSPRGAVLHMGDKEEWAMC